MRIERTHRPCKGQSPALEHSTPYMGGSSLLHFFTAYPIRDLSRNRNERFWEIYNHSSYSYPAAYYRAVGGQDHF